MFSVAVASGDGVEQRQREAAIFGLTGDIRGEHPDGSRHGKAQRQPMLFRDPATDGASSDRVRRPRRNRVGTTGSSERRRLSTKPPWREGGFEVAGAGFEPATFGL